jgi:hypothetical protein
MLIFLAMVNYLTDAYRHLSSSAQAAASSTRAIAAICLPFAAAPMYHNLGVRWACSLLALVSLLMAACPFLFIKYGDAIQRRSLLSRQIHGLDGV